MKSRYCSTGVQDGIVLHHLILRLQMPSGWSRVVWVCSLPECHSHMALKYHNDESSSMSWALHFNACTLFATYQWTCCSSHVLFTVIITLVQGPAGCDLHWCQRNLPPLISSASSVSIGSSVTCAREVANTVSASLTRQRFWGKFDLFGVLPQSH